MGEEAQVLVAFVADPKVNPMGQWWALKVGKGLANPYPIGPEDLKVFGDSQRRHSPF